MSGFHSLVSSGTSSKQVLNEKDTLFVGMGSMLTEGALAILVIIAVAAGIGMEYTNASGEHFTGIAAWTTHYKSWGAAGGLTSNISAFVEGSANMISSLGIPKGIAVVIMGVFVASFAGTTLDTATRIQRYVVSEIMIDLKLNIFKNRYFTTALVVITAAILAFISGANGAGALKLWPLFGAINQTLAALALIIITMYLKRKGGLKWLLAGIPSLFMVVITMWASIINQLDFSASHNLLLQVINIAIIILVFLVVMEGFVAFFKTMPDEN